MLQVEFLTIEEYDLKGQGKLASFVRKTLRKVMEEAVVLQLSWSGITKRMAKKSNLKELHSIRDLKGIVMLIKGKHALFLNYLAFKMKFTSVKNCIAGACYDSFYKKIEVTSENVEAKIQKTLHNIHWENKQKKKDKNKGSSAALERTVEVDDSTE